jgi:hypothetical protein
MSHRHWHGGVEQLAMMTGHSLASISVLDLYTDRGGASRENAIRLARKKQPVCKPVAN